MTLRALHRLGVPLLFGAGVLLSLEVLPRVPRDTSLEQLLPAGSESRRRFAEFDAAFGTDDVLLLVVTDDDANPVFRRECLEYLDALDAVLSADPAVESVVSLATLEDFDVLNPGGKAVPALPRPYLPRDRGALEPGDTDRFRRDPLLRRGLLSEDGRSTACWVLLHPELRSDPEYLHEVRDLVRSLPPAPHPTLHLSVTGFPVLQEALWRLLWRDGVRILAASVLGAGVAAALSGVALRSVLASLAAWPLIAGLLGAWCVATGRPLHAFSNAVLPLLLVTSAATLVHVGRRLREDRPLLPVLWRCLLTTTTTAVGFGSLAFSGVQPLARLGVEVAAGSFLALVLTSAMVMAVPVPRAAARPRSLRLPAAAACALTAGIGLLALPWFLLDPQRTESMTDLLDSLPANLPEVQDARAAADAVGAPTSYEVVVLLPPEEARARLADPQLYEELARFERELVAAAEGRIVSVLSPVTLLSYLNTKLEGEGDAPEDAFRVTPAAAQFAIQWLVMPYVHWFSRGAAIEDSPPLLQALHDRMRQLLSPGGERLRFGCRLRTMAPQEVLSLTQDLEEDLFPRYERLLGAADVHATGYALLVSETTREVRVAQVRSLIGGGLALALLLFLVLRSLRLWVLACATNAAAILGLLNFVWFLALPLNLYSVVLVASLLGIIVDDTIHLLSACRSHGDVDLALAEVGPSLIGSSASLAVGFALFLLSELPLYRQFALCAVVGVALSLAWDVFTLPALVRRLQSGR